MPSLLRQKTRRSLCRQPLLPILWELYLVLTLSPLVQLMQGYHLHHRWESFLRHHHHLQSQVRSLVKGILQKRLNTHHR